MAKDRRAYYVANRERILVRVKARAEAKRDDIRAYKKSWHAANRERIAQKKRERYAVGKVAISQKAKQRYANNPEPFKARSRLYRAVNLEKARQANKAWRKANAERVAAMKLEWQKADYKLHPERYKEIQGRRKAQKALALSEKVDFKQVLKDSKGLCGICGKPLDLFGIDFDHILPLARGGTHTRDNIQATHSRCNRSKGARVS